MRAIDCAEYIVDTIAGTRFTLLNAVPVQRTLEAAKAWALALHNETELTLRSQKITAGHPLFSRMLAAPDQKLCGTAALDAGVSILQLEALVKAHVLTEHVDGKYSCAARHVVKAFERLRDAPCPFADAAGTAPVRPLA